MKKKLLCLVLVSGLVLGNWQTVSAAKKPTLSFKKLTLNVGQKKKIAIKNKNKKAVYTFRSSSKKTAAVSSKGVITAVAPGEAVIKATLISSRQKVECRVIVLDEDPVTLAPVQNNSSDRKH